MQWNFISQCEELSLKYDIATECANENTREHAVLLGYAVMVLLQSKKYSLFQILTIKYWINQAITLGQIKFFFDWDGSPIGFITWAYLAKDVEIRMANDKSFLLHFSEWNEGGNLWVIDFCMPTGDVRDAVRYFLEEIRASSVQRVSWVRRRADYSVRKICEYETNTGAFLAKLCTG
jgi:cytolysin-activating lysine-acyltransferase